MPQGVISIALNAIILNAIAFNAIKLIYKHINTTTYVN
jgi:hypothetical protein